MAASSSAAAALPAALTTQILQHVPQQHRLTQCSLVSQAWASAAALATAEVRHLLQEDTIRSASFQTWLNRHAGQLRSLWLKGPCHGRQTLQLPLHTMQQLQRLCLEYLKLQLPIDHASSDDEKRAAGECSQVHGRGQVMLPSLQNLHMWECQLAGISSLLQLMQAPHLTSLQLPSITLAQPEFCGGYYTFRDNSAAVVQVVAGAVAAMLQQLPRLIVLELPGMPLTDAAVQHTGAMQSLQSARLEHVHTHVWLMPRCELHGLPSSITQLLLRDNRQVLDNAPSLPPHLHQLTALVHLELTNGALQPALLGSVAQLRHLHLIGCSLLPSPVDVVYQTQGTAALLDVLPQLTALQHLELELKKMDTVSIPPQRFAALTASSHLTQLCIATDEVRPLPLHAVQHMVPAGRQMPLLQVLSICSNVLQDVDDHVGLACMDGTDIARICSSCRNLRRLCITCAVRPDTDLSVLLQLPASCADLEIGGVAFSDAAVSVLTQLTQLRDLCWTDSPGFTDAGFEMLTALTQLARLYVNDCGLSSAIAHDDEVDLEGNNEHAVWQQVDALCDNSPVCAPQRLKVQKAVSAAQLAKIQSLEEQLQHSQAQNRQLQQQLAAVAAAQQQ